MLRKRIVVFILVLVFYQINSSACTIIAVGKKASKSGANIISHTDTGPDSRIFVFPSQSYEKGEKAPVYWGIQDPANPLMEDGEILGYIPQVQHTYKYFHSAYSNLNEFQLGIAESTTAQRDELICTRENNGQIMTIEQAQIFALQRYKTAKDAVQFIGELMVTYGFLPSSGGGSETLIIADTEEIWVFEVFGVGPDWNPESGKPGAIWAAQRLPEDAATIVPNWSIIKEIDAKDKDNFMVSDNYKQEAIDRSWYDPGSGKPFIWQDAYSPLPVEYATGRFWLFHQTFAPNFADWPDRFIEDDPYKGIKPYFQTVEPVSFYPFSVKPEINISVQDIITFQRSTFEGTIYDMTLDPNWLVPDGNGGYKKSVLATPFPGSDMRKLLNITYRRPVARHRGHYGWVLELRDWLPDEIGGIMWLYLDNPYFSPYVPIYAGNLSVDPTYKTYNPDKYEENSARWAIDFVDNLANLKFQEVILDVKKVRDPFEKEMFKSQKEIEDKALELLKENPGSAQEFLTGYSNGLMQEVTEMFLVLRDEIISKYTNNHE
ncbi:MAG: C69 family dipeptidase [Bacteroidales bacterium]|nr:C69 family dipeptidase [Bacteroidales bacterium]